MLLLDILHNAPKKVLYPDSTIFIILHQCCFATKPPEMAILFRNSTQSEMSTSPNKQGPSGHEEWVCVDADDADDSWVDVPKEVPTDTGRGASDVPDGCPSAGATKFMVQVLEACYKENLNVTDWRDEKKK